MAKKQNVIEQLISERSELFKKEYGANFHSTFEFKGVIKELRREHPEANIVAVDYDPSASEVNQLNRIKLMLATANKNLKTRQEKETSELA